MYSRMPVLFQMSAHSHVIGSKVGLKKLNGVLRLTKCTLFIGWSVALAQTNSSIGKQRAFSLESWPSSTIGGSVCVDIAGFYIIFRVLNLGPPYMSRKK